MLSYANPPTGALVFDSSTPAIKRNQGPQLACLRVAAANIICFERDLESSLAWEIHNVFIRLLLLAWTHLK